MDDDKAMTTIALHGYAVGITQRITCMCGWSTMPVPGVPRREIHASHVLAVLSETHKVVPRG